MRTMPVETGGVMSTGAGVAGVVRCLIWGLGIEPRFSGKLSEPPSHLYSPTTMSFNSIWYFFLFWTLWKWNHTYVPFDCLFTQCIFIILQCIAVFMAGLIFLLYTVPLGNIPQFLKSFNVDWWFLAWAVLCSTTLNILMNFLEDLTISFRFVFGDGIADSILFILSVTQHSDVKTETCHTLSTSLFSCTNSHKCVCVHSICSLSVFYYHDILNYLPTHSLIDIGLFPNFG